jgi:hypothetical protein
LINEDAARLIEFLNRVFEAKEINRLAGPDGRVLHAEMKIGDSIVSGGVRDLAGNHWWIAAHIEDVPPDELKLRAERWMKQRTPRRDLIFRQ